MLQVCSVAYSHVRYSRFPWNNENPSSWFPMFQSIPSLGKAINGSVGIRHAIITKGARSIFFKQEERTAHRCSYDTIRAGKKSYSYRKNWSGITVDSEGFWRAAVKKWGSTQKNRDNECASGKCCLLEQHHSILLRRFRTMRRISWQGCTQNPSRQKSKSNQETNHNIIFYYNLFYLMVWLMILESSGFAVLPHFSIKSSSTSTM